MQLSKQTTSFIIVMLLTVGATYGAIYLNRTLNRELGNNPSVRITHKDTQFSSQGTPIEQVDTKDWSIYSDKKYPVSFKYPKEWQVSAGDDKSMGVYKISLKPNKTGDPLAVYITKDNYFAIEGLPLEQVKFNNFEGVNSNDYIIGLKKDTTYYTFDIGQNVKLQNVFFGILNSVEIKG